MSDSGPSLVDVAKAAGVTLTGPHGELQCKADIVTALTTAITEEVEKQQLIDRLLPVALAQCKKMANPNSGDAA